jgi:hypothetical protein
VIDCVFVNFIVDDESVGFGVETGVVVGVDSPLATKDLSTVTHVAV